MLIPSQLLLCWAHWQRVPFTTKCAVRDNYRRGQELDRNPTGAWVVAAQRAICAVAVREKLLRAVDAELLVWRCIALFVNHQGPVNPPPPTRVVNRHKGASFDTYIGRGSPFGNPYSHHSLTTDATRRPKTIRVRTRAVAIAKYREWITSGLVLEGWVKPTVQQILDLKSKRLGCSCKPAPCHGDVLAELADRSTWWFQTDGTSSHPADCACPRCEQIHADDLISF